MAAWQFFSKPDCYCAPCRDHRCAVTGHHISAPAFMRGVTALFIADVHALSTTPDAAMTALKEKAAALRPGLLLLGGDYSDKPGPAERLFERLAAIPAPLGRFGVVGNNDREAFPDIDRLRRIMARAGVELLINEARTLRVNGGTLTVAGLDEYRHGAPDAAGLYPDHPSPDCFRLLLSHYPRRVDPMPDLMLCGHTHGGQFNLLGVTPYTVGFERLFARRRASRFIAGLHPLDSGQVLVSKGIGASRIPLRVGVRPEIELLRFE